MEKLLKIFLFISLAIGFNVNAAIVNLAGHETVILEGADLTKQLYTAADGNQVDTIIAYTSLSNSDAKLEADWMKAVFGELGITGYGPLEKVEKIEFDTDADSDAYWGDPVENGIYTGELNYANDYYLVKIGEGHVTYDTFLYENLAGLLAATVNLEFLKEFSEFDKKNFDIYRISHISEIPIPASIWLFSSALLGFIGLSRKTSV